MALRLSEGLGLADAGIRSGHKFALLLAKPRDAIDDPCVCAQSVAKDCYRQAPQREDDRVNVGRL